MAQLSTQSQRYIEYDKEFYDNFDNTTRRTAEIVLPYVIKKFHPKSIIDFGCGEGMWLSVVNNISPEIEICGIDGDYICVNELKINRNCFFPANLEKPIRLGKQFDLAMSFEVGEHLDESCADIFVENISRHSNRILFSAAIPNQGGVHHINEKWQSYWIKKFEAKGYFVSDSLRNHFWNCKEIPSWRRQNILLFSKNKEDFDLFDKPDDKIFDVVHPELYLLKSTLQPIVVNAKEIYSTIDRAIKALIDQGIEQIIICPYGNHGFLCKEILNHKYHIDEIMILDNKLCLVDSGIYPCSELKNLQGNYYVLENSWDKAVQTELVEEMKKYISEEQIISIFGSNKNGCEYGSNNGE